MSLFSATTGVSSSSRDGPSTRALTLRSPSSLCRVRFRLLSCGGWADDGGVSVALLDCGNGSVDDDALVGDAAAGCTLSTFLPGFKPARYTKWRDEEQKRGARHGTSVSAIGATAAAATAWGASGGGSVASARSSASSALRSISRRSASPISGLATDCNSRVKHNKQRRADTSALVALVGAAVAVGWAKTRDLRAPQTRAPPSLSTTGTRDAHAPRCRAAFRPAPAPQCAPGVRWLPAPR